MRYSSHSGNIRNENLCDVVRLRKEMCRVELQTSTIVATACFQCTHHTNIHSPSFLLWECHHSFCTRTGSLISAVQHCMSTFLSRTTCPILSHKTRDSSSTARPTATMALYSQFSGLRVEDRTHLHTAVAYFVFHLHLKTQYHDCDYLSAFYSIPNGESPVVCGVDGLQTTGRCAWFTQIL